MNSASLFLSLVQAALPAEAAVRSAADERFKLWGVYSLADPWFLLLIPVGLLALLWGRSKFGRERGRVPVLPERLGAMPGHSLAQRLAWLPGTLSAAAIVLVAIAL